MKELLECFPVEIEIHAVWSTNAVFVDDKPLDLEGSQRVIRYCHAFHWGYNGSGPAQLALALLLRYIGEDLAFRYHQKLMTNLIAKLPDNSFIRTVRLREHMARIIAEVDGYSQPELF